MWTIKMWVLSCLTLVAGLTVHSRVAADVREGESLNLFFSTPGGSILDKDGQGTGFTTRLTNTGSSLAANDTRLDLNTADGTLAITTSADPEGFYGQTGLDRIEALGIPLSSLGYDGTQDFEVAARFLPISGVSFADEAGIFIGTSSANMIRAGHITFSAPEFFAANTINGQDMNQRFFGFGFNPADGMTVSIRRTQGVWEAFVDGVAWFPNTDPAGTGQPAPPLFLNSVSDLTVGVYATNSSATAATYLLDSFQAFVFETCPFSDTTGGCTATLEHFQIISEHMFETVIPGTDGDFTFDGIVNYEDFRYWKENYDAERGAIAAARAIPEPINLALIIPAVIMTILSRGLLMPK